MAAPSRELKVLKWVGSGVAGLILAVGVPLVGVVMQTREDIADVRVEVAEVRGEIEKLRGEVAAGQAALRGEVAAGQAALRGEMVAGQAETVKQLSALTVVVGQLVVQSNAGLQPVGVAAAAPGGEGASAGSVALPPPVVGLEAHQDKAGAVKRWRAAAERGDAQAQHDLGQAYAFGEGVGQDRAEAAKWWREAAAQGHGGAQYCLGVLYLNGDGVPRKDKAEAVKWFVMASNRGHPDARQAILVALDEQPTLAGG